METPCPVSVMIATKNEERNLGRCLEALAGWADEIVVVDSQSTDRTVAIAEAFGALVLQFHYQGGWPKKRQWTLDTFDFRNEWVLILDADEIIDEPVRRAVHKVLENPAYDGYWLRFEIVFLGRQLRCAAMWKLCLFRHGKGRFEKRFHQQDLSMSDAEVNDHVLVEGPVKHISPAIRHENWNTLDRYIDKHNEYSNLEARVRLHGGDTELPASLLGPPPARRRWLKRAFFTVPGSSLLVFTLFYFFKRGFLDGVPGFIFCVFRAVQIFHIKSKMYEISLSEGQARNAPFPF